jgi:hypothetical protein
MFVLLTCFVAGFSPVNCDDADMKKTAKAQAEEIQTALVKGDFAKVADLTHPKAVDALGGKKKMAAFLADGMKAMKEQGIEFKNVKILDPSEPVKAEKDAYIVVPFTLELTASGKKLQSKGAIVGVSSDGGKTWVFLDANPGRDKLKLLLPDLPDSLVIPKQDPPKVID